MRIHGFGHALYAIAAAGLAILMLTYHDFAPLWHTVPEGIPWREAWVDGVGLLVLAAAGGLCFSRTALPSVRVIGAYAAVWALMGVPPIFHKPLSVGSWYGVFEALTPLLGAWILFGFLRSQSPTAETPSIDRVRSVRMVQVLFGVDCVVYGLAHFAYAHLTKSMVPAWLPGRLALAYVTGLGHLAAGIALIAGRLPRLAATLEALMMSLFGVLVWVPTLLARIRPVWAPTYRYQWSEFVVTLLLAGSAWLVASSLRHRPWGFAARSTV